MAGGKGGSTTTTVAVPEYIEKAAQRNLNKAEAISQIGYVPYYGPDVAAFQPMQNAAFQNTAGLAGAFGMASPTGSNVYGSMGAPTDYGGGLLGYSSQPIYQQAVDTLRAKRPGQYNAMTQMFVDPYSGSASNYMLPQIDYTNIATAAETARNESAADRANQLAIANANANANPSNVVNYSSFASSPTSSYLPGGVNDPFLTRTPNQLIAAATDTNRPTGAVTTSPRPTARPADLMPNPAAVPAKTASKSSNKTPTTPTKVATTSTKPTSKDKSSSSSSSSSGKGCVVATHAVASGAFTPKMKREAVVWCMDVLHGKWWGEAIRRGYRYLGRKKIEQGKAHEHYTEFRRYIAFANGSKRDLRGALTFTLRTAQFFVVGMFAKEA